MRVERAKLSRHAEVAKAMDYMLKRWVAFTRFLDDGRICLTTDDAEKRESRSARHFLRFRGRFLPCSDHAGDLSPYSSSQKQKVLGCRRARPGGVSLFGRAAFLRPGLRSRGRRAQPGSRLAAGHRRRRREAVLTQASTAAG
jgi:hypothetical protein